MPFWLKFALREARSSARRLAVYMGAITLGVAALVAINSFREQLVESVDSEAKALLGADVRLDANRAFPDSVEAVLDSASAAGIDIARVTTALSVLLTATGDVQLVQVRTVDNPAFPFYGEMATRPAGLWRRLSAGGRDALVEAGLFTQLGIATGDSIRLGDAWFEVVGALTSLPPELNFRNMIGPRVYIPASALGATNLLQYGSLANYEAYLRIPGNDDAQRFVDMHHDTFQRTATGVDTSAEQAEQLGRALESLGRFLGLVGLSALLLGGLGVASAVNVFVKDRRRTVAVLRCLGATQRTAFSAYLVQATALGTLGAVAGAVLGVLLQAALPTLLGSALPIDVPFAVQWTVVAIGIGIGALVAGTFALLPLLEVRGISPLRALRADVADESRRADPWRVAAGLLIVASVVAVAIWQAGIWQAGLAYAGALVGGMIILWLCAALLIRLTRQAGAALRRRRGASFALRTGIANLHRPRNQTVAVTMALGFGVFLVATLWVVQKNLLGWMRTDASQPQPNLVFFDIQQDQMGDLRERFAAAADRPPEIVPIVPARLVSINGRSAEELLDESPRRVEPWAVRREYRHTYRDTLTSAETLVEGDLFDGEAPVDGVARVSIEQDVARNLDVGIGDRIGWDIAGVEVESVVTSIRTVDWARFQTNFFFVFEPGTLDDAPQSAVSLVAIEEDSARAQLQRSVVTDHPNISVVDLASVQRMLQRIIDRIIFAIRFMAGFSVAGGVLVLFGAIAAARFQRVRESAMLRAIGATRHQVWRIMLVEYAALGALAGFTGVLLAGVAGWLLMRFIFEMDYALPVVELVAIWVVVTVGAAVGGLLNSREALRSTPLAALREAET